MSSPKTKLEKIIFSGDRAQEKKKNNAAEKLLGPPHSRKVREMDCRMRHFVPALLRLGHTVRHLEEEEGNSNEFYRTSKFQFTITSLLLLQSGGTLEEM